MVLCLLHHSNEAKNAKKAADTQLLASKIGSLRLEGDSNASEDMEFAAAWIEKLYKCKKQKLRDTQELNDMAELTAKITQKLSGSEEDGADPMDYHYTRLWIKEFSP